MAKTRYLKVKLKNSNPFWATIVSKGDRTTLYQVRTSEGEIKARWDGKEKAHVVHQELVSNSLIVYEKPAIESYLYGWLVLDTAKNRKINAGIQNTGGGCEDSGCGHLYELLN